LRAQRTQEVRLAAPGIAEDEQRVAVTALRELRCGRTLELVVKHLARLGMDRFDVERIALVDLRAMRDRGEDLRAILAAERGDARIGAGHRDRLEQLA